MVHPIRHHLNLIPTYIRLALKRESEYKTSFYLLFVNQFIEVAIWLVFWGVIIGRIESIGSWDFAMLALLTGFIAINSGFFSLLVNIWRFPQQVLSGELNMFLIRPLHPLIHLLLLRWSLRGLTRVALGLGIIIVVIARYDLNISWPLLAIAIIASVMSFAATFFPFVLVCLSAFWLGKADFFRDLFIELFIFENYPLTEFPQAITAFFTVIIPLIFAGTIPVLIMTTFSWVGALASIGALLLLITIQLGIINTVWRRGLARYDSFGG